MNNLKQIFLSIYVPHNVTYVPHDVPKKIDVTILPTIPDYHIIPVHLDCIKKNEIDTQLNQKNVTINNDRIYKQFYLDLVKRNASNIKIPLMYYNDREIMLAGIFNNPEWLSYASHYLYNDYNFNLQCLFTNYESCDYMNKDFLDNKKFILEAISNNKFSFSQALYILDRSKHKLDPSLRYIACRSNGWNYICSMLINSDYTK